VTLLSARAAAATTLSDAEEASAMRILALQVERAGVARGIQVGADSSDRTVSQQTADRIQREAAEIAATRADARVG